MTQHSPENAQNRATAIHRLGMNRVACPELAKAEAEARLDLAIAIMTLDEVEDRIAAGEQIHSVNEQLAVERTQRAYAQALANFIRRDAA